MEQTQIQRIKEIAENLEYSFEQQCFLQLDRLKEAIDVQHDQDSLIDRKHLKRRLFRWNVFEEIESSRRQYLDRVLCHTLKSLGEQIRTNIMNFRTLLRDQSLSPVSSRGGSSCGSLNNSFELERPLGPPNSFFVVDLRKKENFLYDKNGVICLKSCKSIKFSAKSPSVQALLLHIIAKTIKLIQMDNYMTKRELYYLSLEFCRCKKKTRAIASTQASYSSQGTCRSRRSTQSSSQSQQLSEVNRHNSSKLDIALSELCCLVGCSYIHLRIVAQSKGLVFGDLNFKLRSGESFDCLSRREGISIPTAQNPIVEVKSGAKFILLVEKESVMQKIISQESTTHFIKNFKVIVFTAKGYPDLTSKAFLNFLWQRLKIPILALTDADPHGFEIVCSYKFGNYASAFEGSHCVIPHLRWLGLLPSDVMKLSLPESQTIPHNQTDLRKLKSLLARPYLRSRPTWIYQLELMRDLGRKAELESLDNNGEYLVQTYLPNKLRYASWL